MQINLDERIDEVIRTYDGVVKGVDNKAHEEERAYGGIVRSEKGKLQEHITEEIIRMAWANIGGDESRLSINKRKHRVPIQEDYVMKIKNKEIREYIIRKTPDYCFGVSVDKQVFIDDKFVIGIECKAYTENAMIKRILVDFSLLKRIFPNIGCYLFQLESQLGGDYKDLKEITFGSEPTHTLMSYFPEVNLKIHTFLEGERKVNKPIHNPEFFKPLGKKQIEKAVTLLSDNLEYHL